MDFVSKVNLRKNSIMKIGIYELKVLILVIKFKNFLKNFFNKLLLVKLVKKLKLV